MEAPIQPIEISSESDLTRYIRERSPRRIAIDGPPAVGKTTIAQKLAASLDFRSVSLDDFLEPNRGEFIEALDFDNLANGLVQSPLIVEGVCMLEALKRTGIQADLVIYMKPWRDYWKQVESCPLFCEVAIYLHRYRPELTAQVIYNRPVRNPA